MEDEMLISQLIKKLYKFKEKYGDIRCVTNGFDETDIDDIATVELMEIYLNVSKNSMCGDHEDAECIRFANSNKHKKVPAVFIDF